VPIQTQPSDLPPCAGAGLFTSTNPELRRVVPENVGDRVCVKLVYVVLEAQYQSAVSNAVKNINAKNDKVRSSRSRGPDTRDQR